jgi:hypothetical protein
MTPYRLCDGLDRQPRLQLRIKAHLPVGTNRGDLGSPRDARFARFSVPARIQESPQLMRGPLGGRQIFSLEAQCRVARPGSPPV